MFYSHAYNRQICQIWGLILQLFSFQTCYLCLKCTDNFDNVLDFKISCIADPSLSSLLKMIILIQVNIYKRLRIITNGRYHCDLLKCEQFCWQKVSRINDQSHAATRGSKIPRPHSRDNHQICLQLPKKYINIWNAFKPWYVTLTLSCLITGAVIDLKCHQILDKMSVITITSYLTE